MCQQRRDRNGAWLSALGEPEPVQLVALGINHASSSVCLRERLAVSDDAIPDVSARLRDRVAEAFVLSTCNRI